MKKYDKIIAIAGAIVLILAGLGIYYWVEEEPNASAASVEDLFSASSEYSMVPDAIAISDECPFYSLIATPLAVNYDKEFSRYLIPMYVMDPEDPSDAVIKVGDQLGYFTNNEISDLSAKNFSIYLANKYWKCSDAVLLMEENQCGYNLGVVATPIASYLGIPIIVTNEIDQDVITVLNDLKVKFTIICGENIEEYGNYIRLETVEEIFDFGLELLHERMQEIDYIALTNPVDAFPPKILDSEDLYFDSKSSDWTFTIPNGYKYALITVESETDGNAAPSFKIGAKLDDIHQGLRQKEAIDGGGAIPKRDDKGNIIGYELYHEGVVYGREGVTYQIEAKIKLPVHVTVNKLESPVYSLMKGISSNAPYLAACHQGLVFGKPEFAFTANDDIRDDNGKSLPGYFMPRYNPKLTEFSNRHIYDNVHKPLNNILAKIAGIELDEKTYTKDIKYLHDYYDKKEFSIAIVGGPTGLPQYIYQNILEPFGDIDGDGTDDTAYGMGGGGTPSDVIYGNIDPVKYDWSPMAKDLYTDLPQMENAIGRIAGWDAQDANALILRSVFYSEIIENLEEWKDNFGVLCGDGVDHQKPWLPYTLEKYTKILTIFEKIVGMTPLGFLVSFADSNGPWKHETGATELSGRRLKNNAEEYGFDVNFALASHAMVEGLTDAELNEYKNQNIVYKLLFKKSQVRDLVGKHVVHGGEYMEQSNYIFANAHGAIGIFGMAGPDLVSAGFGKIIEKIIRRVTPLFGGWIGPGAGLEISYTPTTVTGLDLGPSFMFLDSCTCGKIDGVYPRQSVTMALLHAGLGTLVASTTGSNIPGGYLPGKSKMTDNPFSVWKARKEWEKKAERGIFPDLHFGFKLFEDTTGFLDEKNCSVGEAFRCAKNIYLPEDIDWQLWWTPPLSGGNAPDVYGPHKEEKHTTYFEFTLYGDPAFNPYEPTNEGEE